MELIAIRDIEPNEEVSQHRELTDKQILTSYIDVSLPVEKRRSELESTYRFKCECSLCLRDIEIRSPGYEGVEVDLRAAVWHRDCKRKVKGKGSLPMGWEGQGQFLEGTLSWKADIRRDESHTMCEMQGTIHSQHCRTASAIPASSSYAGGGRKGSRRSVHATMIGKLLTTQISPRLQHSSSSFPPFTPFSPLHHFPFFLSFASNSSESDPVHRTNLLILIAYIPSSSHHRYWFIQRIIQSWRSFMPSGVRFSLKHLMAKARTWYRGGWSRASSF